MRFCLFGWLLLTNVMFGFAQQDSAVFQLIFIGDAGDNTDGRLNNLVSKQIPASDIPSAVLFLGDNIYPKGLPPKDHQDRKLREQTLLNEIAMASSFGDIYFLPGNHDWKNGHHDGLSYRHNQQDFLDSLRDRRIHFLPRDGCPGPEEIKLSEDVTLVILDTQWFLHPWEKPEGETSPCESKSAADAIIQLDDILNRNQGKRVIVTGHHPVYTYGPHGGVFTWKDHLFPLTELNPDFYLPLPIIGSLVPLYRSIFGNIQDSAHPANKSLRHGLRDIMKQYPGTVYVSGHEHALQYIEHDSIQYIGSGAGSKSSHVKVKGFSKFGSSELGFARMLIMKDGKARTEFYSTQGKLYSTSLQTVKQPTPEKIILEHRDSIWVNRNASYQYEANSFRRTMLGENYRKEWIQKIPLPAFDIQKEMGGLQILQRGGGMETMTLRLKDSAGREYNLRTIEKYPVKALPPSFRKTFLQAVVQDQVSAAHPYGALIIPTLAEAAKVYHTNPRLFYAPNDPRWGVYRKDFAGQSMLFEERPDGPGKGLSTFGNPVKMISTRRLLEHLAEDNDVVVDQKQVLRSRLFDMLIGDWDRHDDQWRWGEFDQKKLKIYKPIPRDRDHAFFVNEGIVPHKWRKHHIFPNLEGFDYNIRWAPGLMQAGRWFDRSFLNAMSEQEFIRMSQELSMEMTDEVIDSAVRQLPKEVYAFHGDIIARKLKARRSILVNNAQSYYRFLSRQVDVVGSNKREIVEASWLPNGNLNLKMLKRDKEGHAGRVMYEREFINDQTREVRIYGQGGDDLFHFIGPPGRIKIRVIGGEGKDEIKNESGRSRIFVYDTKAGTVIEGGGIHNRLSSDPKVNLYDRKDFEYNKISPRHTVTYNIDDGVFIGTGFSTVVHGFRKKPYQSHHMLQGTYAIRTQSFNIRYEGRFPKAVGKWDLELDADVKSPNYVNNFFGWGNESTFNQFINEDPSINVTNSIDYYRLRFREMKAEVKLYRRFGQWGYFKAGPVFQRGEIVDPAEDRYIKEYNAAQPESILGQAKNFGGVTYSWGIDRRDNTKFTTRGIVFRQTSRFMEGFDAPGFTYHQATFTLYQSFRLPAKVTFVFNMGAGHNTGTYQLYQAQALDGKTEIRGFRKTRFYGDTKFYVNNEMRVKLGNLRTYLFPAAFGVHFFYDVGRVWYKDENGIDPSVPTGSSNKWHHGFGGGLWFTPYSLTSIVTEIGSSEEGTLFYLRLGFLF